MTRWLLAFLFCLWGAFVARHAGAAAATGWMMVYGAYDFHGWAGAWHYVWNARIPNPPVLAFFEYATRRLDLTTQALYRASHYLPFAIAFLLAASTWTRLCISGCLIVLFCWCAVLLHTLMPMIYDLIFPLGFLVFLAAYRVLYLHPHAPRWQQITLAAACGLCLTQVELLRPFVIYLLPGVVLCVLIGLRRHTRGAIVAFLLPLILITGVWHAHLLLAFGQTTWSNHTGFNMQRAWVQVPAPPLVPEIHNAPLGPKLWPNLDTPEHEENNRRLQRAVAVYIVQHPLDAAAFICSRLLVFMSTPVTVYGATHSSRALPPYRLAAAFCFCLLFLNLLMLLAAMARLRLGFWRALAAPDHILIFFAAATIILLAIGDAGEETRFVLSVLPFYAALPRVWTRGCDNQQVPASWSVGSD